MGLSDHTVTPNWRSAGQASLLSLAGKLYKRLQPYRWLFAMALVLVLLMGALELLKPWPLKLVVDHVLTGHPMPWVWLQAFTPQTLLLLGCAMLVLVYALIGAGSIISNYITIHLGQRLVTTSVLSCMPISSASRWPSTAAVK